MQLSRDGGTRHRRDGCTRRRADGACVSPHCGHAMAGRAVATYGSNRAGRSRSGDMNGRSFRAQFRRRRTSTDVSGRTAKPLFSGSNPLVASKSPRRLRGRTLPSSSAIARRSSYERVFGLAGESRRTHGVDCDHPMTMLRFAPEYRQTKRRALRRVRQPAITK
jgi:uncharacterized protein RhaS with RHS repeats